MSATEIVNIIKAINDHVTLKYCDSITGYLNDETHSYVKFERDFFNAMDKAVQKLINDITTSLNLNLSTPSNPCNTSSEDILREIQRHCDTYNQWKKNMYDNHLHKIEEIEKNFNQFVQKTLKAKLVEQHNLFDTALSFNITNPIQNTQPLETANHQSITPINSNDINNTDQIENNINNLNQINQFLSIVNDNNDNTSNSTVFSNDCNKNIDHESSDDTFNDLNGNICNINPFPLPHFPILTPKSAECTKKTPKIVPIPPPKPPPPTSDDDDTETDIFHHCGICNQPFDDESQWISHLRLHQKTMKSTNSTKKATKNKKRKRKRAFKDIDEGDKVDNVGNKRKRYRFQCEYCDKQYFLLRPYIKHYNYHIRDNENNMCCFCEEMFESIQELKQHISVYNAGMIIPSGEYQCCQCENTFKEKIEFKSHLNSVHKQSKDGKENME